MSLNPAAKPRRGRPPKVRLTPPAEELNPPDPTIDQLDPAYLAQMAEVMEANPAFAAAFELAMASVLTEWSSTLPEQTARREHLWAETKALERLRGQLNRLRMASRHLRAA